MFEVDSAMGALSGLYQLHDPFAGQSSTLDPWYSSWWTDQSQQNPALTGPLATEQQQGEIAPGVFQNPDTSLHGQGPAGGDQTQTPQGDLNFRVGNWMADNGYGRASYDSLVAVGDNGLPSTNGKWYLRPDAAFAFLAMNQAYFRATGQHIRLASAYRNFGTGYETDRSMDWHQSDHASGGAIDIGGTSLSTPEQQAELAWMKVHAKEFGFGVWGGNWGDDGHFSFSAGGFNGWMTHYSGPTAADKRWIQAAQGKFGASTGGGGPAADPAAAKLMAMVRPVLNPQDAAGQMSLGPAPFSTVLGSLMRPIGFATMPTPPPPPPGGGGGGGFTGKVPRGGAGKKWGSARSMMLAAAQWAREQGHTDVRLDWAMDPHTWWITGGHGDVVPESGLTAQDNWGGIVDAAHQQNPNSSAYGLGQFLDATWGAIGYTKTSNPFLQAAYYLIYIAQRYGSPEAAWAHKQQTGWY